MTRPLVGLDMFYYAEVLDDDAVSLLYDTPVRVNNLVSLTVSPNSESVPFFADDGPREVVSQIGEVDVSINVADLPPENYAFLVGADYDAGTGVIDYSTEAAPPEVAIGFRAKKTNGEYRYMWLLKGRFGVPNMEHQTQEGSVNFQTQTINGKFMSRIHDNMVFRRVDSDDANVSMTLPTDWFNSPELGGAPTPLGFNSVSPANLATGVAVDTNIEWTFNDDVFPADATTDNFKAYNVTSGVWVTGTVYVDPLNADTVIFTPSANLENAELHVATVAAGVRSTSGGALASDVVTTFTTVA